MNKNIPLHGIHYIASFIAGLLLVLSFAPFNQAWLAIISPAILLYVWLNCSAIQAFLKGLCFGCGFFLADMYWIYISIHHFGHAPLSVSLLLTVSDTAYILIYGAAAPRKVVVWL